MPPGLSEIERKILDYMVQYLRENTYQPSIREIGRRFGIKSTKTVSEHLQALATKGYLERDPSRSRGVRILNVDLHPQTVSVPCYAELPDDGRHIGGDGAEMHLTLDRRLAGGKGAFFVRNRTEELAAVGVGEGDFVLLEPTTPDQLQDGEIVVARISAEPRYYRVETEGGALSLRPLRRDEPPTVVEDPSSLDLIGRVAAAYRKLGGAGAPINVTAH